MKAIMIQVISMYNVPKGEEMLHMGMGIKTILSADLKVITRTIVCKNIGLLIPMQAHII